MTTYTFPPNAAVSQAGLLITDTVGQVYALDDTSYTTPLTVTDVNGLAKAAVAISGIGQTEIFRVEDQTSVMFKSGDLVSQIVSFDALLEQVEASADSARASADAAALALAVSASNTARAADVTYDRERRQVDGSMRFVREMMHSTKRRPATRSTLELDRQYPDSWIGPLTGTIRFDPLVTLPAVTTAAVTLANPANGIPDSYRGMIYGSTAANGRVRAFLVHPKTGERYDTGLVGVADAAGNWGLDLSGVETWRVGYWEIHRVSSSTSTMLEWPPHTVGHYYSGLTVRAYGVTDADYPSPQYGWVGVDGRVYVANVPAGRKVVTVLSGSTTIATSESITGAARSYVVEAGQAGYETNFELSSYVYDQALALMAAIATQDEESADALLAGLLQFQRTTSSGVVVAGDFIFTGPQHNPKFGDDVVRMGASAVATYALLKYIRAFPQRASALVRARAVLALNALAAKQQTGGVREGLLLGGVGGYEPAIPAIRRRNLTYNPGPRSADLGGYGFTPGVGETRTPSWVGTVGAGPEGDTGFYRNTVTAVKTSGASGPTYMLQSSNLSIGGVNEGEWVLMSCWVRLSRAATITMRTTLRSDSVQKATQTSGSIVLAANTWTEFSTKMQVPLDSGGINGHSFEVLVPQGTVVPVGGTYDLGNLKVEKVPDEDANTTDYPYFDASFVTTDTKLYSWDDLANASSSVEDTPGSGQRPNLDYRIDWVSTEHNLDAFWAFDLAEVVFPDQGWLTRSQRVKAGLLTTLWNAEQARFNQGYQATGPDTADALDLHSWGAIFLEAIGEEAKARAVMTEASLAPFFTTIDGVTGYGIADPAKGGYDGLLPNVWSEGTFGVALALRRLEEHERRGAVLRGIDTMQHEDGGWKYVQRVDVSHELTPYRSVAGSAWAVLSVLDEIWTTR